MKTYEEWRYSSTFLDFGTRCRQVVSYTPLPLYPRGNHSPRIGLDAVRKREILYCLESNPGHPAHSPSACRLSYPDSFKGFYIPELYTGISAPLDLWFYSVSSDEYWNNILK
jgi:hypothetical protein